MTSHFAGCFQCCAILRSTRDSNAVLRLGQCFQCNAVFIYIYNYHNMLNNTIYSHVSIYCSVHYTPLRNNCFYRLSVQFPLRLRGTSDISSCRSDKNSPRSFFFYVQNKSTEYNEQDSNINKYIPCEQSTRFPRVMNHSKKL